MEIFLETERLVLRRFTADDADEVRAELDGLAAVPHDCVAGGASVSYMAPFSHEDGRAVFEDIASGVEQGRRLLLAAFSEGQVVGTVQVILATPPNQPHRASRATPPSGPTSGEAGRGSASSPATPSTGSTPPCPR